MQNRLRARLRTGITTYGLWVTMESASISELAALLGLDWICVDMEHGHLSYKDLIEHLRAVQGSETSVVVRVPAVTQDAVKRTLDVGADGVILPLVRSAADLAAGMSYALYPPRGERGIGGERAVRWGLRYQEYLEQANDEIMVIPLIETVAAVRDINAILAVSGLDALYVGPADLSASQGYVGAWEGPGVAEQILDVRNQAARQRIVSGIMATSTENARARRDQGFGMIGLGSDGALLIRHIQQMLEDLRGQEVVPR
jgi:2-keto-3-deoxy-L-rhamnonate aldolase RhmA